MRPFLLVLCCFTAVVSTSCMSFENPSGHSFGSAKPGITFGTGFVTRRLFASPPIGTISDMAVETGGSIAVAGDEGGSKLDSKGDILSSVTYAPQMGSVSLVELARTGNYDYLSRGNWSSPSVLFDSTGTAIWTSPTGEGVDDSTAGDFLGKGTPQVAVAYNGDTGVSLFAGGSKPLWNNSDDGDCWHIEAFREHPGSDWRIVYSEAGGNFGVRDVFGKTIAEPASPGTFTAFSLCHWPTNSSQQYLIANVGKHVSIFTINGKVVKTYSAPYATLLQQFYGCPVRLKHNAALYFALLGAATKYSENTSTFSLYDKSGKLVYQENLPELCGSMVVLPAKVPGTPDTLLIGGTNHIWRY